MHTGLGFVALSTVWILHLNSNHDSPSFGFKISCVVNRYLPGAHEWLLLVTYLQHCVDGFFTLCGDCVYVHIIPPRPTSRAFWNTPAVMEYLVIILPIAATGCGAAIIALPAPSAQQALPAPSAQYALPAPSAQ